MIAWKLIVPLACVWLMVLSVDGRRRNFAIKRSQTSCPCGVTNKGRVVGGSKARANQYPWIVSLVTYKGHRPVCGATILTEWIAITAAHCTESKEPMSIKAGTSDINKPGIIIPLQGFSPHNYNPAKTGALNDVSLLFFTKPIVFNSQISPVCLPTGKLNLDNKWVKILGWGMQGGNKPGSNHLLEADLQVVPFQECKIYHPGLPSPPSQLCIKAPGKGGCFGDSGGPIVWLDPETNKYTLVGLVSFGSGNCDPNVPTVNSDVTVFYPWIRDNMHHPGCHKI